jgi:hypothetical protein
VSGAEAGSVVERSGSIREDAIRAAQPEQRNLRSAWPKMNDMTGVAQKWQRTVVTCALLFIAMSLTDASARSGESKAGRVELSFLSGTEDETKTGPGNETQEPAEEMPVPAPQGDSRDFDGVWIFTSAGCPYTGSLPAKIVGGKIIVRGGSGQVDRDGTLHSVGAGNGMTLTATGQLSGATGSGTFNRSDGCVGSWIAIKRGPLSGRR